MKKAYWAIIFVIVVIGAAAFFISGKTKTKDKLPATVDFNLHIRPILSDRCFKCHGPDANKRKAGLRLDIADSAFAALKEGFPINYKINNHEISVGSAK
jgi:hypothetical protein